MKNEHRMFLQGIMCRKLLNANEVRELLRTCCNLNESNSNDVDIATFINTINNNIHPFHMLISKCIAEQDGKQFYALINDQESPLTRLATDYTSSEVEFFKCLIETIVHSEQGCTSSTAALNLVDVLSKSMSRTLIQQLLSRLEEDKWIIQVKGRISLSPLAILELDQFIRDTFADVVTTCNLCKRLTLQGQNCRNCDAKFHLHCAKRYFQDMRYCPSCKAPWPSGSECPTSARASKRPLRR